MAVYIVTYDTEDDDVRAPVRERGDFVAKSVYLIEYDGTATQLLRVLIADIADAKKMQPKSVTLDNVLAKGERLVVIEAGADWNGRDDGVDFSKIEKVLGPRGT